MLTPNKVSGKLHLPSWRMQLIAMRWHNNREEAEKILSRIELLRPESIENIHRLANVSCRGIVILQQGCNCAV